MSGGTMRCPKCDTELDVQVEEPDVGIFGSGIYCDDCDLWADYEHEYHEDDVIPAPRPYTGGTPISDLATQPGCKGYDEWLRICKSWGHE